VHVIIAGCGRVGSLLAGRLDRDGHEVVIIDRDRRAFGRLPEDFTGRALEGIVFDRTVLEEAGVARAEAFVAVTSGDNSNVVAARTASERYGIDTVVARIYDPVRAGIYERLGITTIASAQWTVEETLRALGGADEVLATSLGPGAGDVVVLTLAVPGSVKGLPVGELVVPGERTVAAVTRQGRTAVPGRGALVEGGDLVHLAVDRDRVEVARSAVAALEREAR
jgi:trk system potassium uptake protein TrkA